MLVLTCTNYIIKNKGGKVRKFFLSMTPEMRSKEIMSLLRTFQLNAMNLCASFIILVYGSGSYGFNANQYGKIDDIDLLLIIPRSSNIENLIALAETVFQTKLDIQKTHLNALVGDRWDMCRMYGECNGIKLGFRFLCTDVFQSLSTIQGATNSIRNVAQYGAITYRAGC